MKKENLINVNPSRNLIFCSAETIEELSNLKKSIFGEVSGVVDISEGGILIPEGTKGYLKKDNGNIPLRVLAVHPESEYDVDDYVYLSQLNTVQKIIDGVTCFVVNEFDIAGKVKDTKKYQEFIDKFTVESKEKITRARLAEKLTILESLPLVNANGVPN